MNITRGKIPGAKKCVLYGPEGIGKSTFASQFPDPVFIDTEDSTKELDVARFDKPTSWEMLLQEVRYVINSPNICKTLVVDTADWAEKLCIKAVCAQYQKSGIEAFDYGRGYTFAYESFGELLNLLAEVTACGIHVVLTAHAATKRREQPDEFGTYDCWGLKLIDSPKCSIANMVKEWADIVLFANYKVMVVAADDKGKKHKAQGGRRVMYTSHHPCWDAKNRLGLPDEMPLDFSALAPYISGQTPPAAPVPSPASPASVPPVTTSPPPPVRAKAPDIASQSAAPALSPEPKDDMAVPDVLVPLLESADVTELEVREVIAKRQGSFPMGTTWKVMEQAGFVTGWVIPFWDRIVAMIREDPDRLPF